MNISVLRRRTALAGCVLATSLAFGYDYDVKMPSAEFRPRWTGARVGEWTMDYEAAQAKAKEEGRIHIQMLTGSWWCPFCQRFEKNVGLSDAWRNYVAEKGFYLSMLDFPYRFPTDADQLYKSKYPAKGDGWGFMCWLYENDYMAENGLTEEETFRTIQRFYERQGELAQEGAELFTMSTWDGASTFTYGKIAYPMLIVYLPDGTEAGRFTAQTEIYRLTPEEAQRYVLNKIDTIIAAALDEQCGLCSDPEADECGLDGTSVQRYRGWLTGEDGAVAGTVEVRVGKANRKGVMKMVATVVHGGLRDTLTAVTTNGCDEVAFTKGKGRQSATLRMGRFGLSGSYADGAATYRVDGARDAFTARKSETELRARAVAAPHGTWSFVMRPEEAQHPMAGGFGALTVAVKGKGKVQVGGKLGDGTQVRILGQLIAGEDNVYCLPLVVNLYPGRKGGFSCNLWFKNGWLYNVTGIGAWKSPQNGGFATKWRPIYSALPGTGALAEDMELLFSQPPAAMQGFPLARDPDADSITARKNGWKGTEQTEFSVKVAPKTGAFSGTMTFFLDKGLAFPSRRKAGVYGAVVGGTGYGTVTVRNVGSWAIRISACAACEE